MLIREIKSYKDFTDDLTLDTFMEKMHEWLGKFGDPIPDIKKSIDYAFSETEGKGGFLLAGFEEGEFIGGLIMNKTGMEGYIPENILVYVAVSPDMRGKGYGGKIVEYSLNHADGNVKLHVEYENPAKRLYERIGFTTKYAEMRFNK